MMSFAQYEHLKLKFSPAHIWELLLYMEIQDDDFILTLSLILNLPFFLDEN